MTHPIDTAYVLIRPDFRQFGAEAKAGITTQLNGVKAAAAGASNSIETGFTNAGRKATSAIHGTRQEAESTFAKIKSSANDAFNSFGGKTLVGLATTAGIIEFGKRSVETFENINKESWALQRVMGGSITQASEWRGAMQLGGVSAAQFTISVRKMSQEIVKGATGSGAFPLMGIAVKDANGHLKTIDELLPQVADGFKNMAPGAEKNALAVQLFGRAGLQMLPFLNRGAEGMADLRKEAEKLGVVIGDKDYAAYQKSLAAQREHTAAMQGLQLIIGRDLLPTYDHFLEFLTNDFIPAGKQVVHGVEDVVNVFRESGHWIAENKAPIEIVAGAITVALIPALTRLAVVQGISLAESAALWAMYKGEAVAAAVKSAAGFLLMSGTATSAAAAEAELAVSTEIQAGAARAAATANAELAASRAAVAGSSGAGVGAALAGAGPVAAVLLLTAAVGLASKKLSDFLEKGRSGVSVLEHLSKAESDLTTAVVNSGGALTDQVKQVIASNLASDGLAAKAAKAGITTNQLTGAITGNADALDALIKQWRASGKPSDDTIAALLLLYGAYHKAAQGSKAAGGEAVNQARSQLGLAAVTADVAAAQQKQADALGLDITTYTTASAAIDQNTGALQAQAAILAVTVSEALLAGTAIKGVGAAFTAVQTQAQPAVDAYTAWTDAQAAAVKGAHDAAVAGQQAAEAAQAATRNTAQVAAQGALSVQTSEKAVADAYTQGAQQIATASDAEAKAHQAVKDALTALTQARVDARNAVNAAKNSLRDLPLNEESARIRLERDQLAADIAAGKISGADAAAKTAQLDAREKALQLQQDKNALADTLASNKATQASATAAVKAGVEGDAKVIAAKKAVSDARKAERDAVLSMAAAQKQASETEQAAVQALARARASAAQANSDAARSEQKAQDSLNTTITTGATNVRDLNQKVLTARDALDAQEVSTGLTDASLKALITTIKTGKFDVHAAMTDVGHDKVADDIIDLQRQTQIAFLILSGLSPEAAKAKATAMLPTVEDQRAAFNVNQGHSVTKNPGAPGRAAGGPGPVSGRGTNTSDSNWYRLSTDEHVLSAAEVAKAGGHRAIEAFRATLRKAAGGPVLDFRKMNLPQKLKAALSAYRGASPGAGLGAGSSVSFTGSAGVEQWRSTVLQALGIEGLPATLAGTTLRRMNQESGGNPTIVNTTDSNWFAGHPSVGLMQVIGPTYASNKQAGYDVGPYLYGTSVNPLANILASMNYARRAYGSLPAAYDRAGGYAGGAWDVPADQLAMLHRKEMVVPAEHAEKWRNTGGLDEAKLAKAIASALAGMSIRFDGDGLARLVTARQAPHEIRGARR